MHIDLLLILRLANFMTDMKLISPFIYLLKLIILLKIFLINGWFEVFNKRKTGTLLGNHILCFPIENIIMKINVGTELHYMHRYIYIFILYMSVSVIVENISRKYNVCIDRNKEVLKMHLFQI